MVQPYEPVSVSKSERYPRTNTPRDGEAVGIKLSADSGGETRFTIEDSRNWFAWIEALDGDSFADLSEMR